MGRCIRPWQQANRSRNIRKKSTLATLHTTNDLEAIKQKKQDIEHSAITGPYFGKSYVTMKAVELLDTVPKWDFD